MWKCRRFAKSRGSVIDALLKIANVIVHVLLLLVVVVIVGRLVPVLSCLLVVARKLALSLVDGGGGDFRRFLMNSEWRGSSSLLSCSASS